jgi:predicted ArsR family transcriptional regulator
MDLLAMLKALGDETRFSMYRELATSTRGCSAHELADSLGLHANTVRLHLDRLREAGLVEVEPVHRGTVGRPTHVYSLAPGAPGLGFDPPSYTLLAGLLAALAERVGADGEEATEIGRSWGTEAGKRTRSRSCVKALGAEMSRLGFEPVTETSGAETDMAFMHCPSSCATCTAESPRESSPRWAGEVLWSSRRCTTGTRAGSPYPSGNLNVQFTSGGPQ